MKNVYRLLNKQTGEFIDFDSFNKMKTYWHNLPYKVALNMVWRFI